MRADKAERPKTLPLARRSTGRLSSRMTRARGRGRRSCTEGAYSVLMVNPHRNEQDTPRSLPSQTAAMNFPFRLENSCIRLRDSCAETLARFCRFFFFFKQKTAYEI